MQSKVWIRHLLFFFCQVAASQVSACFLLRLPFLLSFVTFVFALVHCFRSDCGMVWVEGFVSSLLTSFQDVIQKATNRAYLGPVSAIYVFFVVALVCFFASVSRRYLAPVHAFYFKPQVCFFYFFLHGHSRVHAQGASLQELHEGGASFPSRPQPV